MASKTGNTNKKQKLSQQYASAYFRQTNEEAKMPATKRKSDDDSDNDSLGSDADDINQTPPETQVLKEKDPEILPTDPVQPNVAFISGTKDPMLD